MRTRSRTVATAIVVASIATLVGATVPPPKVAPATHDIRPGTGWTVKALSDYTPGLAGTAGDTLVYVCEGPQPGGTVFVTGGTHGNEVAGYMAATLLVERARVQQGRLVVIPHANNSAVSWVAPTWKGPTRFTITTASGPRTFMLGTRLTRPEHQGVPDPPRKNPAGADDGFDVEARNLDRAYPGTSDGTLTDRIAFAIMTVIRREHADVAFDLHEAPIGSRLAMMIVANPKNIDLGAAALLSLEGQGLEMKLEPSSLTFRGLSHREWGDATDARAFLFETPSPVFDATTAGDIVTHPEWPLARRVGVHLATLLAVVDAYNGDAPAARHVALADIPDIVALGKSGLGAFLK